jgi:hypothetical protein
LRAGTVFRLAQQGFPLRLQPDLLLLYRLRPFGLDALHERPHPRLHVLEEGAVGVRLDPQPP